MKTIIQSAFFVFNLFVATLATAGQITQSELYDRLNKIRTTTDACGLHSSLNVLLPNVRLEEAARLRSEGKSLGDAMNLSGYSVPYAKVLVVGGASISQVMDRLRKRHCKDLTNPNFVEIGAVWAKDRWWILLAAGVIDETPQLELSRHVDTREKIADPAEFLKLVNTVRAAPRACGDREFKAAESLKWQTNLAEAALVHALDISKGKFSHTGSDGSEVWDRIKRQGYNYNTVGENIAMNPIGAAATVKMWLNSQGHCANIMNPDFTELGAAVSGDYSVLVFGAR